MIANALQHEAIPTTIFASCIASTECNNEMMMALDNDQYLSGIYSGTIREWVGLKFRKRGGDNKGK